MGRRNASKLWIILLLSWASLYACTKEVIRVSSPGHGSTPLSCEDGKTCDRCKDGRDGRDGRDGKDGAPGLDGAHGRDGRDGKDGKDGKDGAPGECVLVPADTCLELVQLPGSMPLQHKKCGECRDSWIDQTFRWTVEWIGSFLNSEPHNPRICFVQALRYSAETMGLLHPEFLDIGRGLTVPRIWSWAQALIGPFLFVMFSLALKNKLKR